MLFKRKIPEPIVEDQSEEELESILVIDITPTLAEEVPAPPQVLPGTITHSYLGKPLSEIPYRSPFVQK